MLASTMRFAMESSSATLFPSAVPCLSRAGAAFSAASNKGIVSCTSQLTSQPLSTLSAPQKAGEPGRLQVSAHSRMVHWPSPCGVVAFSMEKFLWKMQPRPIQGEHLVTFQCSTLFACRPFGNLQTPYLRAGCDQVSRCVKAPKSTRRLNKV